MTLNGEAVLRYTVRRVDPIAFPVVMAPPLPAGIRDVTINRSNQSIGNFATLRDLALSGSAGAVAIPPGTYGSFTASGDCGFVLGVNGATVPAVYNLQNLTLNGKSQVQLVGPVVITFANGATLSGAMGSPVHPEWMSLRIASGGLTLNGDAMVYGDVVAPNGIVTLNGKSCLTGSVVADRLTISGDGLLTAK